MGLGWNCVRIAPGIVLAVGITAVSTASIFIRYAQLEAPSFVIATYRLAVASLVLVPVALLSHRARLRTLRATEWRLLAISGAFLALHFAAWITSLEYTTVASSVVLVSTSPLWVAFVARLFFRERLARPAILGLIMAVGGAFLIGLSDTVQEAVSAPLLGDSLAVAGAVAAAGYWLIGRRLRVGLSLVPYVTIVYSAAAVVLLAMTVGTGQPLTGYQPLIYAWFLLLGLVPQLIGHSSFNWALERLPATFVAIATLGEAIGSTALAFLLLGETPSLLKIVGAAIVLAGIVLTLRSQVAGEHFGLRLM